MGDRRYPKDLFCSIYSEGGRCVQFVVRLKNMPEAIAKVSNSLAVKGINILSGFHAASPGGEEVTWGFFIDLKGLDLKPEDLAKEIEGLDVVLEAKFSPPMFDGLIIDEFFFPLMVLGERSVVVRVETFGEMFRRLYESFGSGAATILYGMGLAAGENKAKRVVEKYGVDGLGALQIILAERAAKGWGIPDIADKKRPEAAIIVQDLFECLPFKGKHSKANSQFFRGYLTGVFRQLFNKKASVTEVECIAKGNPNCKFISEPS
jgi:predicted hydrocarbon binding protein